MKNITIYHNPRCSKSRETLKLLQDKGAKVNIIEYLKTPPSHKELKNIIDCLGINAEDLLRTSENVYQELELKNSKLSDKQLIDVMIAHPALIQRPIVIKENEAIIDRPPEKVLSLFE